jgi:hypothetical protein
MIQHICVYALFFCLIATPVAIAEDIPQLTPAEIFVLHELKSGRAADLSKRPPESRILSPHFVEKLLTGGYSYPDLQRQGVVISNAVLKETLIVSGTEIPFRVWLMDCTFERGVDFGYTTFDRDLSLENSRFGIAPFANWHPAAEDIKAFFVGMKVAGTTVFSGTSFYIPADFTYAETGSDFLFDDSKYESREIADFENTKIKGPMFFRRSRFSGRLSLNDAELFELFVEDIIGPLNLDMAQTHIERSVSLKNIRLDSWKGKFLTSNGEIRLDGVIPTGMVDLAHSHFQNLTMIGFNEWLKLRPNTLNLDGLSFESVDINDNSSKAPSAQRMLELIDSEICPYSPQPYTELEKYFIAHGETQQADETYMHMRRRQRQKLAGINRPWDWLLDKSLGYGRQTWRAAICAMALVIVGVLIFSPKRMEWKNAQQPQEKYSRFLYSLDQLAPVIDLEAAKNWGPIHGNNWTQNYSIFHRIAGWILLPLILGAITGLVK